MADDLKIFDPTFYHLQEAMSRRAMMQAVIAHNIANANTPGFKPRRFDEVLQKVVETQGKVELEKEMADMSENSGAYGAYVRIMNSKLSALRSIVTQGRK